MTIVANTTLNSRTDMVAAIRALQIELSRPVCAAIDDQLIGQQVVVLQKYLATIPDETVAGGFMFDPLKVRSYLADHSLPGAIIHLQSLVVSNWPPAGEQFLTTIAPPDPGQYLTITDANGVEQRLTISTGLS